MGLSLRRARLRPEQEGVPDDTGRQPGWPGQAKQEVSISVRLHERHTLTLNPDSTTQGFGEF